MTQFSTSGWECLFFVAMIGAMALLPLVSASWWRKWYPAVTLVLALPVVAMVAGRDVPALFHALEEYGAFVLMLGALYVISGGILVETAARGRPASNTVVLLAGAVLANLLGTTGASVVLIRPLIRANAWRQRVAHIYVFFIFIVSNFGGLITPLGDPPLFLGFLRGVPFFWTLKLLPLWGGAVGLLLGVFWVVDTVALRRDPSPFVERPALRFGLKGWMNLLLLGVVVASLFLPAPFRVVVLILAVVASILWTPATIRLANDFSYHPLVEVAVLFAGIFVTLIPVQGWIHGSGLLGWVTTPGRYFWVAGGLSSVLDNAPTYLVVSEYARNAAVSGGIMAAGIPEPVLLAISAGCVLMGANTYIGNGPNQMVKAICEDEGIAMPSFTGFMAWSGVILVPVYILVTVFFLRN